MSKATKSIVGSGGGGGKGGGGSRSAVEAPDSIFSKGILKVIDLIGEGEIAGLVDGGKSIFLNETPLISSAGQSNFGDVAWETRVGTPHQDVMKGFSDIETPYIVGVEVFKNSPQTFTISNPDTDTANASGTLTVRGSDGNAYGFVEFLTSTAANTWTRVSGAINAIGNNSSLAMLRLENDAGSGSYIDFTGLMMEELIGNIIAPSAFIRPPISSIAGMPLDQVYSHVVDFTTSNNRDSSAIAAPAVASDDSALDFSINTDGSANISLQWTWTGDEGSIDGFAILAYTTNTNHGVYTFGTNPAKELVMQVPANRRAFIANGVAANAYYTVGVAAYRSVDKSVVASGVVTSAIVYANGPTERPFRPSVSVEYTGNVSGTVGGVVASTLVTNAATALAAVNDMSSDSLISPVEKGLIRKEWNAIASEKSIVESQATTYSITTEKTNYTNALQALGNYINGSAWTVGTVPLYINDANLGTATPIDKTIFRLRFKDYYDARTTVIKKITDTANTNTNSAATTANWSGVASRPTNLTTLAGSETIKNSDIYLSGGAIQGIGTGSGTIVSNSLITLSASGTLNGAGGGTVTLAGMGAGTFATLNQLNASNIASYLAANSIGDTYLQSIAANKITAGSLAAGVIYAGTINASQINAGTLNAMTLTASSITGTSGINITGVANFSGSGSNAITGDNAAINASSSVHGIVSATYNSSAYALKAYNSGGGIAFYCAGSMVTGSNAVVTNFNADMVDGVHATNLCSIVVGNNGTCNVSGTGFNLNTSTGLTSYEFYSSGNNVMLLRQISDKRLKTDIEPETLGLSFINRLQPVSFRKIADPAIKQHGFLADHLERIIGSVNEDALSIEHEEGTKGFDYIALIGPLVKAVQELTTEVNNLKTTVNNQDK